MTTTFAIYSPPAPSSSAAVVTSPLAEPQTALRTYRDTIREISPWWLRGRVLGSVLYAIAAQLDVLQDATIAGVKLRFPGAYSYESLPLLGRDRRIRRGRFEADETYASRLLPWLDDHQRRGGPYALLAQLHAHYAPHNFGIELRYVTGRNFVMALDGTVTRGDVTWTPPGNPAQWARWWLIYQWPDPVDDDGLWGDPGIWGDGGVWGSNLSPAEVRDIRLVPREWNAAHAIGRITLVSPLKTVTFSVEAS
jgi:hypothetical protein